MSDLTSTYSGGGYYDGSVVIAFETYGIKPSGYGYNSYGVQAAQVYSF